MSSYIMGEYEEDDLGVVTQVEEMYQVCFLCLFTLLICYKHFQKLTGDRFLFSDAFEKVGIWTMQVRGSIKF